MVMMEKQSRKQAAFFFFSNFFLFEFVRCYLKCGFNTSDIQVVFYTGRSFLNSWPMQTKSMHLMEFRRISADPKAQGVLAPEVRFWIPGSVA